METKKSFPTKKTAAALSSFPNTPPQPTNGTHDPAAVPSRPNPPVAPLSAFPVDRTEEPKRGPGRPPKVCDICGKVPAECKGHAKLAAEKFFIGDETVKGLITMLSQLTAISFSMTTGVPAEDLGKVWSFTEGEKSLIAPPAAEWINKEAPEWMQKYETQIKLGFVAIPILIAKLTVTYALVKMHREKLASENASPSPAAGKSDGRTSAQATAA
jgi:hypothetical protein